MTLRADDGQASGILDLWRQLDIRTTAGHVGGYGDCAQHTLCGLYHIVHRARFALLGLGSLSFQAALVLQSHTTLAEAASVGGLVVGAHAAASGQGHDVGLLLVQLGIQNLVWYLAHGEHLGQHLADLHAGGTHKNGTSAVAHLLHLLYHGLILLALGLVDAVVGIDTDDRAVGGHFHHVQLVYVPELAGLGNGRTCHARQLVVHAEIVLQGDGGVCLCGGLHLDMLLGLHGLVQSVAPAASLHDTAGLLVHDLYLTVLYDILIVQIEHGVGLEQLLQGVHAFALDSIVGIHLVLLGHTCLLVKTAVGLYLGHQAADVGQDEQLRIVDLGSQPFVALVREVHAVLLLVDDEEERFHGFGHAAVVVLHVYLLGGQHAGLDARLGQELDQGLVLGQCLETAEERQKAVGGLLLVVLGRTLCDQLLCLGQILGGQCTLYTHETLHQRLVLLIHLVVTLGHGAGDDQRRTGIVDQDGVHLVHYGKVVLALNQIGRVLRHVVTKIVKAELIVGAECDVGQIGLTTCLAIGLMLVYAVHTETMEHVDGPHPLGVALGQVVVHCNHMHAIAGESIEEHGQSGRKGLTLTGEHLGNLALMQYGAAEKLNIEVNHSPLHVVTAGHPVVVVHCCVAVYIHKVVPGGQVAVELCGLHTYLGIVGETLGGTLYYGKDLGTHFVQGRLQGLQDFLLQLVYLLEKRSTVLYLGLGNAGLDVSYLLTLRCSLVCYILPDLLHTGTQLIVAHGLHTGIGIQHGLYQRAVGLHVAGLLVSEQFN